MRYKVNVGSPVLSAFGGLSGAMAAVTVSVPEGYKWIPIVVMFAGIGFLLWQLMRLTWKNRYLQFCDEELVLPRRIIASSDIKHILIYERTPAFIVYFKERKLPFSVAFTKHEGGEAMSALRQWTWKNGVKTRTNGRRKIKRQVD